MNPQFAFSAYGLATRSDFDLGECDARARGEPGLLIRDKAITAERAVLEGFRAYRVIPEGDLLDFRGVGRFLVRGEATIDVDLEACFDRRLVGLPLLGPVMALLLHRRGLLVLHGSAVRIGGKAQVFLGDKGAGKSTTAAALIAGGFPLVSDDVIAIERLPSGALGVRPGYPAMKLDVETLARFDPSTYRILPPNEGLYTHGKSRVRFHRPIPPDPVPLGKVYCLARGDHTAIKPLAAERRLNALIRYSHYPRLGPAANSPAEAAHLFRLAAHLAEEIEVETLIVKQGLAELGALGPFLAQEPAHASNLG